MQRYQDKRVLITAGAKAIGLATAMRLMHEGARVLITDIDSPALQNAQEEAQSKGFNLETECFNLMDVNDCAQGINRAVAKLGRVDVIVNNAGGSLHTPYKFEDESEAHWESVMSLNVMATVRVLRHLLPQMVANKYGRVVMLGSKAGRYGSLIAGPNYAAAKGAIHALTRQIAMEYGPHNITCNAICPGVVMTERVVGLWAERRTEEERAKVLNDIPLRRHACVDDIAAAIAFFGSDDAAFITGTLLDVNGGQAMSG